MEGKERTKIQVVVLVDEDGNAAVGVDEDEAKEKYYDQWEQPLCLRCFKIALDVPNPKIVILNKPVADEKIDVRFAEAKSYEIE